MTLSRRDLLRAAPLAALAVPGASHLRLARAAVEDDRFPGMIVRQEEPRNLETPLTALRGGNLPTEHFFVRNHFAVPSVDLKTFKLTVEGHVANKLELALDDLKKMEAVSHEVTLECAGNGRVFLVPQVRGAAMELRRGRASGVDRRSSRSGAGTSEGETRGHRCRARRRG